MMKSLRVIRYLAVRGLNRGRKMTRPRTVQSVNSTPMDVLEHADQLIAEKYSDDPILLHIASAYEALSASEKQRVDWSSASRSFVAGRANETLAAFQSYRSGPPLIEETVSPLADDLEEAEALVKSLTQRGESELLEFKSTLRWDICKQIESRAITKSILKTICAFLNTRGGILLTGVADDGSITGLAIDKFENADMCLHFFANQVRDRIGAEFVPCIRAKVVSVDGREVLLVDCQPSSEPAFVGDDKFFIRNGTTTEHLPPKLAMKYILQRSRLGPRAA